MSQLKKGALLSYISIFITIIVSLTYIPIIIRLLGQAEYGLYSLIGSIAAYLSIMDLGLGNAVVRYNARNRAIGDKKAEARLNGIFLSFYSILAIFTIIIGLMLYNMIEDIFGNSLSILEIEKAKLMIIILVLNFAFSFPLAIFSSIMQAYERFVVLKVVVIIRTLLTPLIILPLLLMGYASVTMVLITSIVNIACLLFNVYYCFKHLQIKLSFGKIDYSLLKEIMIYSMFIFLGIVVDQINWNTGQLILGVFSGTAAVAVFAIAIQFIRLYLLFSTSISGLLLPRISIMVANNASPKELTNIMIKFGRIQYIIMGLLLSGFILFGKQFISLWAGPEYVDSYYMILIIMIPITIPLIQNTGLSILQAKNLMGFRSMVLIVIGLLNVIISIPLALRYEGIGVAMGTGISYVIGNIVIMNIYYHKKINIDIPLFWNNIIFMSVPMLFSLSIGYGLNYILTSENIINLFVKICIFSLVYLLLMWFFGLNEYEKKLLSSYRRRIKSSSDLSIRNLK